MTVQGILDTLRRSPKKIETWDSTAAAIGAALLKGLTQAEVRQLADGVARIASEGQQRVLIDLQSSSRMVLAMLRGASHTLAEEVAQELEEAEERLQRPKPQLAKGKKTWVCASCGERYAPPDMKSEEGLICVKLINDPIRGVKVCDGDLFDMNETAWACVRCSDPLVTYLDRQAGIVCQDCWDAGNDIFDRT